MRGDYKKNSFIIILIAKKKRLHNDSVELITKLCVEISEYIPRIK
jgi:hypothetical protein